VPEKEEEEEEAAAEEGEEANCFDNKEISREK